MNLYFLDKIKIEINPKIIAPKIERPPYSNSMVKNTALQNLELLQKVVEFKDKFYHCSWAKYENAKPGMIKLLPPVYNIKAFKDDYEKMKNMIYGDKPDFDSILHVIAKLEKEINKIY